jgi:hypothetical protein
LNIYDDEGVDEIEESVSPLREGKFVKVRFWPKPRVADYDFKEYFSLKTAKMEIKLGSDHGFDTYFRIHKQPRPEGCSLHGSFDFASINPTMNKQDFFEPIETGAITPISSIPEYTKATNAYASFVTSLPLFR